MKQSEMNHMTLWVYLKYLTSYSPEYVNGEYYFDIPWHGVSKTVFLKELATSELNSYDDAFTLNVSVAVDFQGSILSSYL